MIQGSYQKKKTEDEDLESSNSDCKYSVFSSLQNGQDKGIYTGWSSEVMGESKEMGCSDTLRRKI